MEMTRRQFLAGLVKVATVVTAVCLVPDCLPAPPGVDEPQPIKHAHTWLVHGVTHRNLLNDGDTINMVNMDNGLPMLVTRMSHDTLKFQAGFEPRNTASWAWGIEQARA